MTPNLGPKKCPHTVGGQLFGPKFGTIFGTQNGNHTWSRKRGFNSIFSTTMLLLYWTLCVGFPDEWFPCGSPISCRICRQDMPVRHETSLALRELSQPLVGKFCREICSASHLSNFREFESRDPSVVGLAVFVQGVVGNVNSRAVFFFRTHPVVILHRASL
jgi:hypothetical protein